MTIADFDPTVLERYTKPPSMLHFQWQGSRVYRYVLVDDFDPIEINSRTKCKDSEQGMTQEEIGLSYIGKK